MTSRRLCRGTLSAGGAAVVRTMWRRTSGSVDELGKWLQLRDPRRRAPLVLSVLALSLLLASSWVCSAPGTTRGSMPFAGTSHVRGMPRRSVALQAAVQDENPFAALGLKPGVPPDQARAAFRKLAKKYHPDVPGTGDTRRFLEIQRAAELLSTQEGCEEWSERVSDDTFDILGDDGWRPSSRPGVKRRRRRATESPFDASALQQDMMTGLFDDDLDDEDEEEEFANTYGREPAASLYDDEALIEDSPMAFFSRWMRVKERRAMRRSGRLQFTRPVARGSATKDTLDRVSRVIAEGLIVPPSMVLGNIGLDDIGLDQDSRALLVIVSRLEEEFNVDLADISLERGLQVKVEWEITIARVSDIADFVQSRVPTPA
eukprot:CAMPEP_0183531870 /NCGR_PEP_ID=MMETSP0371-20130417/25129_1 /TAXON_ID=268820 /ORGANISM="Peridinium aciculiferum, Strain PAER-2" /LENGTH=373 /DNA_ID=CAMNT_0025731943 /DNA_START=53 /DNA_END=1174 /DNA_ORIENTATION=+